MAIYLFFGEESYLLDTKVKKMKREFGNLINGINFIQIDDSNVKEIISDIETPAFGYEKKLIIAKNTGLFKKEKKTAKGPELENIKQANKVAEYINENVDLINAAVEFIFVEEVVEKNELYKAIEKNGTITEFAILKLPELVQNIQKICAAYKVKIDSSTAKYFIECCGTNMQDLINEVRKLIEFVGADGIITNKEIDLLCIKQIDSVIFDLTDNLGKRDIEKAMQVLKELIYEKEPIQKILITLYNHFKKLYIVKIAEKYRKDLAVSMKLKPNQMFLVNKYKMQARYFTEKEIRQILQELINLDANYKIGLIDINVGLEAILCRYCS